MYMAYTDAHSDEYFEMSLRQLAYNLEKCFTEEELNNNVIFVNGQYVANVGEIRSIVDEDEYLPTLRGNNAFYAKKYIDLILHDQMIMHYKFKAKNIYFKIVKSDKLYINPLDPHPVVTYGSDSYIDIEIDSYPSEGESLGDIIRRESEENEMINPVGNEDAEALEYTNTDKPKTAGSGLSEVNLKSEIADLDATVDIASLPDVTMWNTDLSSVSSSSLGMPDNNNYINLTTAMAVMANKGFDYTIDKQGRMILRSNDSVFINHNPIYNLESFSRSDFITIPTDEAKNIKEILDEVVLLKQPDGNDYKAFGSRSLAYERLIDSLNGALCPANESFTFKIKLSEIVDSIEKFINDSHLDTSKIGVHFIMDEESGNGCPVCYSGFISYNNGKYPHSDREATASAKYWINTIRSDIKKYGDISLQIKGFDYKLTRSGGFSNYGKNKSLDFLTLNIWR